ncbi:MAG: response regulator transcription factor [Thermodesulfobacteriota bacterium]
MSKKNLPTIKTLIACSHSLYGEGVSKILSEDKKVDVVSVVSTLIDLIEFSKQKNFDILLLDVAIKGLNLNKILVLVKKNKNAKVILLIDNDYSENLLINGLRSGIRGYVQKNVDTPELIQSVKAVNDGELWADRKLMGKVVDGSSYPTKEVNLKGQIYDLTETEIKIIKLVLTGMTNRQVADDLYISEKTVKFHLYKVFKKLTLKNRSELMLFGFRSGLVT